MEVPAPLDEEDAEETMGEEDAQRMPAAKRPSHVTIVPYLVILLRTAERKPEIYVMELPKDPNQE